ncbi:MAG TPA: winged helix-turn-helix domain-containing protein, partial [Nitrosopumilaceae archaeon]|nr:winged helix-turn-helix domain-containing protein [Nitrosopumilaceae archaeon]
HVLKVFDLELNTNNKQVSRCGEEIKLTAREFMLLEYFIKNKGKVLSRSDLANNVWDTDFDTGTNVVDVYINYLRNKVDKGFEPKLIHTVVGMGYILKDN